MLVKFGATAFAILDPYAVGRLPMVQLVHDQRTVALPYREGDRRSDVRDNVIRAINYELCTDGRFKHQQTSKDMIR